MSGQLDDALRQEIYRQYGMQLGAAEPVYDGDEAEIWRVERDLGPIIVRRSPAWRTMEELTWVYQLVAFAADTIPEAIAPLPADDGTMVFYRVEGPVAVFPYVDGIHLDRNDPAMRSEAATLLARLHRTLPTWPDLRARPPSQAGAPDTLPRQADPAVLDDPDLDAWHREWRHTRAPGLLTGPVHGDFYRRNILCRDGRIVGLIDWDEARQDVLVSELAWTIWELTKAAPGNHLDLDRAHAFLGAYAAAGGDMPDGVEEMVIPLIRWHLREEARHMFAARAHGIALPDDEDEYIAQEIRAFTNLRGLRLPGIATR